MSKDKKKKPTKVKLAKRRIRTLSEGDLAAAAGATTIHCLTQSQRPATDTDSDDCRDSNDC